MASSARGFVPCDAMETVGSPRAAAPATLPELGERDVDCTAGRDEPRCVRLDRTSDVTILRWLHRTWGVAVDPHRARICFGTNKGVLFFTGSEANLADAKEVLSVYPMAAEIRLVSLSRWGPSSKSSPDCVSSGTPQPGSCLAHHVGAVSIDVRRTVRPMRRTQRYRRRPHCASARGIRKLAPFTGRM